MNPEGGVCSSGEKLLPKGEKIAKKLLPGHKKIPSIPGNTESEEPIAKVISSVIPAEAVIQNCSKILDSGSPPAFAGVARNDGFLFLEVLQ